MNDPREVFTAEADRARWICEVESRQRQYGLGSAAEEARRFGVLLLPRCINQSSDPFVVEPAIVENLGTIGAIRVPLTAIRGFGPEAAQHITAVRAAFGEFTSLLDFCRRVDRRLVSRHDIQLLIKLGAFSFTGLSRAQLSAAELQYTSLADLLRSAEGNPAGLASLEDDLASGAIRLLPTAEWSPETIAAYERAHLTASPIAMDGGPESSRAGTNLWC